MSNYRSHISQVCQPGSGVVACGLRYLHPPPPRPACEPRVVSVSQIRRLSRKFGCLRPGVERESVRESVREVGRLRIGVSSLHGAARIPLVIIRWCLECNCETGLCARRYLAKKTVCQSDVRFQRYELIKKESRDQRSLVANTRIFIFMRHRFPFQK